VHGFVEGAEVVADEQDGEEGGGEKKQMSPEGGVLKFCGKLGQHKGVGFVLRWFLVRWGILHALFMKA